MPLLRPARRDRVRLRRRSPYRAAPQYRGAQRRRMGRLSLHAQEYQRPAVGTLDPCARLPTLVQRGARHRHPQDHQGLQDGRAEAVSNQSNRLAQGGSIDRSRAIGFTFDGRRYEGHPGDTLASALLANGVHLVGRSFKYHRPRGILTAGSEEPNALIQLGEGATTEPNLRAPQIELFDGLVASSQNRWPSLRLDIGSINNLLSRYFPAGFYYKTFMWPPSFWMKYEYFI